MTRGDAQSRRDATRGPSHTLRDGIKDESTHLLGLLIVHVDGDDARPELRDGGHVPGEHAHVASHRGNLDAVDLGAVHLDLVRHVEVQRELRGRRRGNLLLRLEEVGGHARQVHRRRRVLPELVEELLHGFLGALGGHRSLRSCDGEDAGGLRGGTREAGEPLCDLTKSHVDVWVSANRVCSGRARRLVALVTRPRRHGLVQTGRISANRRGVSLSKSLSKKSHD